MRLFGTSGIRGSPETLFTNQFCFDIGRTFAKFLDNHGQSGPVAVGMDPRQSSQRIKEYFCSGLIYEKRKVFDEGIVPIPAMNWILVSAPFSGSAMITGSHVKRDLNGIKFFVLKEEILKVHEKEIEKIYQELKEKVSAPSEVSEIEIEEKAKIDYQEMLSKLANLPYPLWKVVLDTGNGVQTEVMFEVLQKLEIETVKINSDLNLAILTRDTETEGAFGELQKKVLSEKADFGLGFDADGDRVIFVDEKGNFIPGDYSGALIAKESPGEAVVTPINTSQVVEYVGKKVLRTKVGSPYVVEAMKKHDVSFGFEANGGGISSEIMMSRDGGSMTIKILNLMKKTGKSLGQLVSELPKFYIYRTKIDCPWEKDEKVLEKVKKVYKGIKTEEIDGLKIWLNNSTWILFRASQNAPEFRVFAEAKDEKEARKLGEDGIELVKEII
ncbi:hypothetical protein COU95_01510 [Candidatus Shapirobacteria bacterium CG10_big_fil_rev_8_21_14_0_10_40_9]|uniref:Phosphoglucosamine mutase n=1 Tax=Candidatus Shapirobacteria bacterium CG10_big_fil_rev_8_21_14_0_10_40_9 TaxID=1974888 RepID=A0A2M8L3Z2_9BACT|nr:MAG: hypothetical protein COU95_01510 [Candidatus Shapirobacteria bacterium CG10_big_fil_rev_8_21_14_0_10_40_9]